MKSDLETIANSRSKLKIIALPFLLSAVLLILASFGFLRFHLPSEMKIEADNNLNQASQLVDRRGLPLPLSAADPSLSGLIGEIENSRSSMDELGDLSIDSELQTYVYQALEKIAIDYKYAGGSGVMLDLRTGEVLVMASVVNTTLSHSWPTPVENKVTHDLFVPGSAIKPFIALAALNEKIISPEEEIFSPGYIELPDPAKGGSFLVFKDWQRHGYVDMRKALGISSNVYFYAIGGGYQDQPGLGMIKIEEHLRLFGFGSSTGLSILTDEPGYLPNAALKAAAFGGDTWRLGDTYLAAIGQHQYGITPLQLVRAVGAIAAEGQLVTPTIEKSLGTTKSRRTLPFKLSDYKVVKEGMEYAVVGGTATGLYLDQVPIAAKTGTTEVDVEKKFIHSTVMGYFPYDKPVYAFVFMLDHGPWGEEVGAVAAARDIFTWLAQNRPEYYSQD